MARRHIQTQLFNSIYVLWGGFIWPLVVRREKIHCLNKKSAGRQPGLSTAIMCKAAERPPPASQPLNTMMIHLFHHELSSTWTPNSPASGLHTRSVRVSSVTSVMGNTHTAKDLLIDYTHTHAGKCQHVLNWNTPFYKCDNSTLLWQQHLKKFKAKNTQALYLSLALKKFKKAHFGNR